MNVNHGFTEAITWALIADIMRRHEAAAGLRVIETHPGGGQYDCRTILQPTASDYGPSIFFNLLSDNAKCFGSFGPPRRVERPEWAGADQGPDRLAYVEAVLRADHRMEVVNYLEAMLGLPSPTRSPATTRHALSYRVMAEVAARAVFDGPVVRWVNGREDASGYPQDDPVRPVLRLVPAIARLLDARAVEQPSTPADAAGYRYWVWTTRTKPHADAVIVAIVDVLDGLLY
ncbi:MAG: hypothetical protein FJX72_21010, partial [Armatimonadetes bacterium]|nr:hypothetical protein [Armatimonadota bacterium]